MNREFLKHSKILVVDDQEANIDILQGLFEYHGYDHVKYTTDSREVLQIYHEFQPDLILLDLMMPFFNGFEIMEQLQKMVPSEILLPILVLTADATDKTKKKALGNGATDFLSKPFDLVEVKLRVENLLYISYLNKQLRSQNTILEEKVRQRTRELELQNLELQLAWEKADASDKLKTAFLNNISHEIRTPLNGIIGFSRLITEMDLTPGERKNYLNVIEESSERLINTVDNFIDISMLTSETLKINLSKTEPDIFITDIYKKLHGLAVKKGIDFQYSDISYELNSPVITDKHLLHKILFQLTENALKFTREGSVNIGFTKQNGSFGFFVKDTGIGISKENYHKVYNLFFQEETGPSRSFEGSGLGLSIAKKMTDLLGGKIWFESEGNKGTCFYISFPLIENQNENTGPIEAVNPATESNRFKILVVEDIEVNYHYLFVLLSRDNIDLIWAKNGLEAVELFEKSPDISLVLMDIKLPLMNGHEASRQIKKRNSVMPIIAVTAYSEIEERKKAMDAGCDDYIVKPIQKSVLMEKIGKQLNYDFQN